MLGAALQQGQRVTQGATAGKEDSAAVPAGTLFQEVVLDRVRVGVASGVDQGLGVVVTVEVHRAQQPQPQRAGHDLGQCPCGAVVQSRQDRLSGLIRVAGQSVC